MKLDVLVAVPPGVVTAIGPVLAPLGTVAVICVDEFTANFALVPLNVTAVAPLKFVPVIVTDAPALPLAGEKDEIVGARMTVKLLALVAVPPGLETEIGPVVAPAGTVAAIRVADLTLKVALMPLKVTAVVPVKRVPVIVTRVPILPLVGVKLSRLDQPDLRAALIGKIQELDVSQREAADTIGVSQQALSSWVSGDSIPSRRQSPRLAKWLDLPEETVRRMRLKAAEHQHGSDAAVRLDHVEDELDSLVRQVEDIRRTQHRFVETVLRLLPSIAAGGLNEHVAGGVGDLIDQLQHIETSQTRHENQ